ncbi:MAG: carbohydrate-binding family 9-like protein [Victivallales bacterium]|nr:carbohydrate-binding family 9-like protein [Victivallales bacterium]
MMKKLMLALGAASLAAVMSSCVCPVCKNEVAELKEIEKYYGVDSPRAEVEVLKTSEAITLDGNLAEGVWAKAKTYTMELPVAKGKLTPKQRASRAKEPFQPADVKFVCTDDTLYIGVKLQDTDVLSFATEEQEQNHLYQMADVVEVFLKSENSQKYWEIYGTPNSLKSTFHFPTRNAAKLDYGELDPGYDCKATVQGTLNNSDDKDIGWTIEMAFPKKMLEAYCGVPFNNEQKWTVLVSRYNYNMANTFFHLSSVPKLPQGNYHLIEYYAAMKIVE